MADNENTFLNADNIYEDVEGEAWGIAYSAGDVSVSYGESAHTNHGISATAQIETEMDSVQIAYTMGAMTVSAAMFETANASGIAGRTYEENEIAVSFAF